MGGRGSSSGSAKGGGGGSSTAKSGGGSSTATKALPTSTKYTTKEIGSMSRSKLESVATAVFIKQNVKRGLSPAEAERRAKLLMDGNSTAQLKKYIKKYG